MRVRAIAIAAERSNAVGTVELECTPLGLSVDYLGVGMYSEGYVPGPVSEHGRALVPWSSVRQASFEGEQLFLDFEPTLYPHHRLTLVNFSEKSATHHREIYRQRVIVRIAAIAAALIAVIVAGVTLPRINPRAGAAAALIVGGAAAFLILAIGVVADRRIALGGLEGEVTLDAFTAELGMYLPTLIRTQHPPPPKPQPFPFPSFQGLLPRTAGAIVITLTASLLGTMLSARWIMSHDRPVATRGRAPDRRELPARDHEGERASEVETRPTKIEERPAPAAAPAVKAPGTSKITSDAPPSLGACRCERSDSLLWAKPLPRLSTIVISKKRISRTHDRLELELAAINNSDKPLDEISLMVEFFERDPAPSTKRYSVSQRALYFEGPLDPGAAIKWSLEARGTEYEIHNPIQGDVGAAGDGAAATNLAAELLNANHRPVRLHGAMLLTYFSDPRAHEATLKLSEALREEEAPYLERLLHAQSEVRTCNLRVTGTDAHRELELCVFNAGNAAQDIGVRVRALSEGPSAIEPLLVTPTVLGETTWKVAGELATNTGARVRTTLDVGANAPASTVFEAYGDRLANLP